MRRLLATLCLFLFGIVNSALHGADNPNPAEERENPFELPTFSLLRRTETFQFKDLPTPFVLKHLPILKGSDQIVINAIRLVKDVDYQIHYPTGTIILLKNYPDDASVQVAYHTLPFTIKKQYKRALFQQQGPFVERPSRITVTEGRVDQPAETEPSLLQVTGTQTFGISTGSGRSLSQNQALQISIDGNVSENVSVTARLSDQDLPIQGGTEDLEDLDQKLIQITSPNITATFGDFEGSLGNSEFIFFPRALEGVQVEGNFKWGTIHLIPSSIPKGQSSSKTIRGEEGRSHYRIDANGEFVIVKAGSEIVWLNGERMRPGGNNDYIIRDYGDPIIEFTNKHLITSNDVIRVDFEFIPEDLAYQRNLYGMSSTLNLPGDRVTVGLAYAVESDLNDPENAFIIINEDDLAELERNELDADLDGKLLIAPQRRTIWGIDGRLNLNDQTSVEGELAFGAFDKNTFSKKDPKVLGQAWKLLANSAGEKLQLNLDFRSLDANFVPVGASSTNRSRFRYEEQYTEERFDDLYLFGTSSPSQPADEKSLDFDVQLKPYRWLQLTSGLGRTEEKLEMRELENVENKEIEDEELTSDTLTLRNNFNWGFDFKPSKLPGLRNDSQRSTSKVGGVDQFRKSRQQWNLSHRLRPFNLNASLEQLESTDLDFLDRDNLNRKRDISTARIDLADFKWASINTRYSVEEAFEKEVLLAVDGKTLGFSDDWKLSTIARTWTIGLFSQPRKWTNLSTNISRRVFQSRRGLGSDATTQLADITWRLTPFNSALLGEVSYELDKKLSTERREFYTNINPYTGREIQPGEGVYVKIDDLHYQEDFEEGNYIKLIQNIGDKPVSAIDTTFRLRFRPRRIFSRRTRTTRQQILGLPDKQTKQPSRENHIEWLVKAISGQALVRITEEQEAPDLLSLYLLRDLQNERTASGRINQRYQLEFSPSSKFELNLNLDTVKFLNRRINNRERHRRRRDWEVGLTLNPTRKISFVGKWEQNREEEQFSQFNQEGELPKPISDLTEFKRVNEVELRYEFNRQMRLGITGGYETTSDLERLDDEPEARTQTLSIENQLIYSFISKGRVNFNYRIGYGSSEGGIPFTRYNFYEGISHEVRTTADYKVRRVTDLLLRFNYRLLSTKQRKPEHRLAMEVVAEL